MIDKVLRWYAQRLPQHQGKNRLIHFLDRLRLCKEVQEVKMGDIIWLLDTLDHIQWHIYYYGIYEPDETFWLKQTLNPGMTVFDVGAHIGYYTLLMSKLVGENGRVHSFEPTTAGYDRLTKHLAINKCINTTAYHAAISNYDGQCKIYCADNSNLGLSSLGALDHFVKVEVVDCFSLDTFIEKNEIKIIDFIKIDVEGAEMFVINGATSLLAKIRPLIMMEINPSCLSRIGANADELITKMIKAGYIMYNFKQKTLRRREDIDTALVSRENVNFVFVPQDRSMS
jgi:FkbM family methyltransferase